MTPTEFFYSCLYRVSRFCLPPRGKHQLPFSIITRLNHFTLSHYGSNGCLSTLKSYLTASTPRLTTSYWLDFTRLGFHQLYMCNRTGAPSYNNYTIILYQYKFKNCFIKKSQIGFFICDLFLELCK
jgi:hypothetical protein